MKSLNSAESITRSIPAPTAVPVARRDNGFNYITYRWIISETGLQMFPESKREFNWSYLVARTLRRLTPGRYF